MERPLHSYPLLLARQLHPDPGVVGAIVLQALFSTYLLSHFKGWSVGSVVGQMQGVACATIIDSNSYTPRKLRQKDKTSRISIQLVSERFLINA